MTSSKTKGGNEKGKEIDLKSGWGQIGHMWGKKSARKKQLNSGEKMEEEKKNSTS